MRFFRQIGEFKGWKRFGFEVAIIVVGLSITLIAQEMISSANRTRVTREAMDAVEVELVTMLANTSERMAIEPCRREQTLALAEQLDRPGNDWSYEAFAGLNADLEQSVLPAVLRTPSRPWPDSSWRALLASDAATGMDRSEFATLSAIYDTAHDIREAQVEAWRLKARLSHLAAPGTLTAEQRRDARAALGELAGVEHAITTNARNLRRYLISIEFHNRHRMEAFYARTNWESFDAVVRVARPVYGACINDAEYQPLYDHYNALTGERATIPSRDAAP